MNIPLIKKAVGSLIVFFCGLTAWSQNLNQIGGSALNAATTNVNGAGIRVAQVEAVGYYFEVNPVAVGQPVNLFTYISASGSATGFTNIVGGESPHADGVGTNFYGLPNGIYQGVATNVAHVDNIEANFFYTNNIANASLPNIGDAVVNQSFTFGNVTNSQITNGTLSVSDQQQLDSQYDNYAVQNNTLFVSAVNNGGSVSPPGTAYNTIGVAAYGGVSSIGPTVDNGRCKPDITAPANATSFATPQVSGAAAVLMQAALRGDGGSDTNSADNMMTVKALLLNGALKPASWTNSMSAPLDARYGAGILNVLNAYKQLAGGKQSYIASTSVSTGGSHPPNGAAGSIAGLSGWDFNTNSSGNTTDVIKHYYFNVTNSVSSGTFVATATLVWNRHYHVSYPFSPQKINNLSLFLYNCANSNLVTCSTSLVDNVEHIFVPQLVQGRYDLQVWKAGGTTFPVAQIVSADEPYALAWSFVSPTLSIVQSGTNAVITWPLYPAGFSVQATSNLLPPVAWSANNLSTAAITNGANYLMLSATNSAQFFRLVSP